MNRFVTISILFWCISSNAYCQRCGSKLVFRIIDKNDSTLCPLPLTDKDKWGREDSIFRGGYKVKSLIFNIDTLPKPIRMQPYSDSEKGKSNYYFDVPTGCGIGLLLISIEKGGEEMKIKFNNIPHDIDFLVDSIPFKSGIYNIDFSKLQGAISEMSSPKDKPGYNWLWGYKLPSEIFLKKE